MQPESAGLPGQTRRQHIATLAALAAPALRAAAPPRVYCAHLAPLGRALKSDPVKILRDIAGAGYRQVEAPSRAGLAALAPHLKGSGLTPLACQTETPLITKDWEFYAGLNSVALGEAIDSLASAGAEYFLMGDVSSGARGDGDDFFRRTADRMNTAAEACRAAGLRFAWPIQGFHFEGKPGLRPLDIFHDRLDPRLAPMELDILRVSLTGHDPTELLRQWKGRVAIVRLLDRAKGAHLEFDDFIAPALMASPGEGTLDFAAILKAAQSSGVKSWCVSEAPPEAGDPDPAAGLRKGIESLRNL